MCGIVSKHNVLYVGTDHGIVLTTSLTAPSTVHSFASISIVQPDDSKEKKASKHSNSSLWIESICLNANHTLLGATCGDNILLKNIEPEMEKEDDANENCVRCQTFNNAAAYAVDFLKNNVLAVGGYGGVTLVDTNELEKVVLPIGAAAVLCVSVSNDGKRMAVGCLDQRVRVYCFDNACNKDCTEDVKNNGKGATSSSTCNEWKPTDTGDWGGFNGIVQNVKWSMDSAWLAAIGGTSLMVVYKDSHAPILCKLPGVSGSGGNNAAVEAGCPQPAAFSGLTWCGLKVEMGLGKGQLLATIDNRNGSCLMYNVMVVDESVPRRCVPVLNVMSCGVGLVLGLLTIDFVVGDDGDGDVVLVWTSREGVNVHKVEYV